MYVRIGRIRSIFTRGEWVAKRGDGRLMSAGNKVSVSSRSELTHTYLPHHPRYQHTSKDITTIHPTKTFCCKYISLCSYKNALKKTLNL